MDTQGVRAFLSVGQTKWSRCFAQEKPEKPPVVAPTRRTPLQGIVAGLSWPAPGRPCGRLATQGFDQEGEARHPWAACLDDCLSLNHLVSVESVTLKTCSSAFSELAKAQANAFRGPLGR